MGKVKQLLIDNDNIGNDDYEVNEALSYLTMLWTVRDFVSKYGLLTVLGDIVDELTRKEIK